jgi:toxin-antitoxin system PIN domain toxin
VTVPDANVLLYAIDPEASQHPRARTWLETALSGDEVVGFGWQTLLAVIRLTTNPAIFENPLAPDDAIDLVEGWLDQPPATIIHPTDRHSGILRSLLAEVGAGGNLASDAHLAALAIEHGATVASFDADFQRFSGVSLEYLAAGAP